MVENNFNDVNLKYEDKSCPYINDPSGQNIVSVMLYNAYTVSYHKILFYNQSLQVLNSNERQMNYQKNKISQENKNYDATMFSNIPNVQKSTFAKGLSVSDIQLLTKQLISLRQFHFL